MGLPGGVDVSIEGSAPTYAVRLSKPTKKNVAYELWVARVSEGGAEYLPVVWGTNFDPTPTEGTAGPFSFDGEGVSAFVWRFPDPTKPVSNVLE